MKAPEVSIVVPVYNAETFLHKMIQSALEQRMSSFELILVDDGSVDNSGTICDTYAQRDQRIRVIHQKNAGVSAARNAGIVLAEGRYIGFIDADDWIAPDMYEKLLNEADRTGADVVMCDAVTVYSNGKTEADTITQLSGNAILKKGDFHPALLVEMAGSAWRCIYRSDKHNAKCREHPLLFPLGVKFSEDRVFNLYAFGQANHVTYLKEGLYYRFVNQESAVHRFHADYFEAQFAAYCAISKAIQEVWNDDKALQRAYLGKLIAGAEMAICNYYYRTSPLNRRERLLAIQRLCNDERLREAILICGSDRKSKWILDRNYLLLTVYARLANLRHGR